MVEAPKDAEKLHDLALGRKLEAHDDLARLVRFAHGLHPSHIDAAAIENVADLSQPALGVEVEDHLADALSQRP